MSFKEVQRIMVPSDRGCPSAEHRGSQNVHKWELRHLGWKPNQAHWAAVYRVWAKPSYK